MIFRFILAIAILYILYRVARGLVRSMSAKERLSSAREQNRRAVEGEDLVEDPFCHTYVPLTSAVEAEVNGERFYFCSRDCLEKFKKAQS